MKRILSLILALTMVLSVAVMFSGCGDDESNDFLVYGLSYGDSPEKKDVIVKYQNMWAERAKAVGINNLKWQDGDFSMLLNSGNYPHVILKGQFSNNVQVAKYADQGILVDMAPYINEKDTPNIWRMFTEQPSTKAIATSPGGAIYALPSYSGNPGAFIETFWYINKAWLDKLNLEVPTNLDELYEVLKAFKANDCNGNGDANDEIPMTFMNTAAYSYPETLLSCWGVSTKFGQYDAFLNVQDGKVNFAPMMDEWKEMVKYYSKLMKEGLLSTQCFTFDDPQWSALVKGDVARIGVTFMKENTFKHADQYIVIPPLRAHADSPDPVMHIHPGVVGTRNACHITNKVKPEDRQKVMKWIDTFYDPQNTVENWYGAVGNGAHDSFSAIEDGVYVWRDPAEAGYATHAEMYGNNTTFGPHMLGYVDSEVHFGDRQENGTFKDGVILENCPAFTTYDENYALYEPYMDIRYSWPRPYYKTDDATTLSNLQTDIFNVVEKYKVRWIQDGEDVDSTWDAYIKELKDLNIDKFVQINQEAYDTYEQVMQELESQAEANKPAEEATEENAEAADTEEAAE